MTAFLEPLFTRRVGGPVSSSPLLVDANGDGWPELFVGGPALMGFAWNGERLPRWPRRGGRPFASSPAFGDINGDGRGEVVCGCDDGKVYAFRVDGSSVPRWPVVTGADVFSTPALADLDADGAAEVVVGSDDGAVRALRGDGTPLWSAAIPGRPFVSASPTVADLDGDRRPEVAVGAWDGRVHVRTAEGRELGTGLREAGNVVWSSATAFALRGAGSGLAWAADRMFVAGFGAARLPAWSRRTGSWMVSSPAVVELDPGEGPSVVVGAERVYAWDLAGRPRTGWPVDAGDFAWSSPIALDVDGDGRREVLVGSWDGGVHGFRGDGTPVEGFPLRSRGPVFSTPAAAPLPEGGGLLVGAGWDGTVRGWRLPAARFRPGDWLQYRGSPERTGLQPTPFEPQRTYPTPQPEPLQRPVVRGIRIEAWAGIRRAVVDGDGLASARWLQLKYELRGEGRIHPVPVVRSRGRHVALIQPLRTPHRIRCWVEYSAPGGTRERWPTETDIGFLTGIPTLRIASGRGPVRDRPASGSQGAT